MTSSLSDEKLTNEHLVGVFNGRWTYEVDPGGETNGLPEVIHLRMVINHHYAT